MNDLTINEVFDGLKKLGINASSDLKTYFREYQAYYNSSHKETIPKELKAISIYIENGVQEMKTFSANSNHFKKLNNNFPMERRHHKRIIVGFNAELILDGLTCEGVIENLSENGINMVIFPTKRALVFTPSSKLELKFQPVSGETLILNCKLRWLYKTPPHGLTKRIGLKIIDPPWDRSDYLL